MTYSKRLDLISNIPIVFYMAGRMRFNLLINFINSIYKHSSYLRSMAAAYVPTAYYLNPFET